MKRNSHAAHESGNALWFILIAIVLIGALTILLTRGGSDVTQSGDVEQLRIRASQLTRYAQGLQASIDQMKMRGVSESVVSFENSKTTADYTNPSCTVPDCKVFDVSGGGQEYRPAASGSNDGAEWIFTGANNVGSASNPIGTTAARTGNDIVMLLPNVKPDLCVQINRDLKVGTAGTIPEDAGGIDLTPFIGTYDNALKIIDGNPAPLELDGESAGCFADTSVNPAVNYIYFTLIAR